MRCGVFGLGKVSHGKAVLAGRGQVSWGLVRQTRWGAFGCGKLRCVKVRQLCQGQVRCSRLR